MTSELLRPRHFGSWLAGITLACVASACTSAARAPEAAGAPNETKDDPSKEAEGATAERADIRLVVFLTVDQLRGDAFQRYARHLPGGGFSRLIERGLHYQNATYAHAITETAPGHATLFTGAAPSEHGIIGNSWLDQAKKETASVDDDGTKLLGPVGEVPGTGQSPRRLLAPTIGDELARQTNGRSKTISISTKARGAILPGGASGSAFWLGGEGFVTSSYYGERMPEFAAAHIAAHPLASYLPKAWEETKAESDYVSGKSTFAGPFSEIGFPHALTGRAPAGFMMITPFGDQALLDFGLAAIGPNELGKDAAPDLLAVSLSATDGIGHAFGPESRESEQHFIALNQHLFGFIEQVERRVGAAHVLWVLSADHGGLEGAPALEARGVRAGRLTERAVEDAAKAAAERLGLSGVVLGVSSPYVVLDHARIARSGKGLAEVRRVIAAEVSSLDGVEFAQSLSEPLPAGPLGEAIGLSIHPARSGDIYVVPRPFVHFVQEQSLYATHGSPWQYDRHVPILLAGPGISQARVTTPVDVRSIAPTVLALLGFQGPAAASAPPLPLE